MRANLKLDEILIRPADFWTKTPLYGNLSIEVFKGDDGALVVQIDTTFDPEVTDFRIWLNDASLHPKER